MLELQCWTPNVVLQVFGVVNHGDGPTRLALRRQLTSPKRDRVKLQKV